jgi:hypothetical protein
MSSTHTAHQDDEKDLSTAVPTPRPPSEVVESKAESKDESKEPTIAEPESVPEKISSDVEAPKTEEGSAHPGDNKRYLTGLKLFLVFV